MPERLLARRWDFIVAVFLVVAAAVPVSAAEPATWNTDENGFRAHRISSPYQAGETTIRVLLPDEFDTSRPHRVLYVLPVVAGNDRRYGDGLLEIRRHAVHNKFGLICVAPEFTAPPWFADHDGDPKKRDESHFVNVVVPFVDKHFPTLQQPGGRLLLGFSKSGWGAFSLLLRHPELFGKASAWDTGILIDTGELPAGDRARRIEQIFGSRETFEAYRLTNLLRQRGKELGEHARLFYYSTGGRREQAGMEIHRLMLQLGIPHRYLFEPNRTHRWDSGWIPQAVRFLVSEP